MMLRPFQLGALALAANAFLLPPNMPTPSALGVSDLGINRVYPAVDNVVVKLECPGCLFARPADEGMAHTWAQDVENYIFLSFSVAEDGKSIELNNFPFFPLDTSVGPLSAYQIPADVTMADVLINGDALLDPPLSMSYSLEARPLHVPERGGVQMYNVWLEIFTLDDQIVSVPKVAITVVEEDGRLSILEAAAAHDAVLADEPVEGSMETPAQPEAKECEHLSPLFCKWKAVLEEKVHDMKSRIGKMHGKRPGCHRGHSVLGAGMDDAPRPPKGWKPPRPHTPHLQPRPHRHNGHPTPHFLRTVRRVAVTVFIPILIGVAAGMTASLLGMIVGSAIGYMWIRFRRGGKRGPVAGPMAQEEGAQAPEKERLLIVVDKEQEAPPQYFEKDGKEVQ